MKDVKEIKVGDIVLFGEEPNEVLSINDVLVGMSNNTDYKERLFSDLSHMAIRDGIALYSLKVDRKSKGFTRYAYRKGAGVTPRRLAIEVSEDKVILYVEIGSVLDMRADVTKKNFTELQHILWSLGFEDLNDRARKAMFDL